MFLCLYLCSCMYVSLCVLIVDDEFLGVYFEELTGFCGGILRCNWVV